ncbi:MAG: P-loop NTPase fold protein, partial [Candidatus Dadabacteria bacterium]
ADLLQEYLKGLGEAANSWGELKTKNLISIKKEISELLNKQSNKIIVVIDDIDRLNSIEIRQIFQLVKSLGDFPNTIYLLAFDKDVVIKALKKVQEGKGLEYLEKVVQIPFEIPSISHDDIEQLLLTHLNDLIKDIPQTRFDSTYWGNVYHGGMKYFFRNIRDVTRYVNTLRFGFGLINEEVNVIDFMAITSLQVFEPDVFYGIRDNKDIFVGQFRNSFLSSGEAEKEQAKHRCQEIIARNKKVGSAILEQLLTKVFPKLRTLLDNENYFDDPSTWRKELRICSTDIFDTYFRLSIPEDEIPQSELHRIISLGPNSDELSEALINLNENKRIIKFLKRVEDYAEDRFPENNIKNFIKVSMDIGDLFPNEHLGITTIRSQLRLSWIFFDLLNRIKTEKIRFEILKDAIYHASQSIETAVCYVDYLINKQVKNPEELNITSDQLERLKRLVMSKIKNWANESKLINHKNLVYILFRWKDFGGNKAIKEFVDNTVKEDRSLITFLNRFLINVHTYGVADYVASPSWKFDMDSLRTFVEPKKIKKRLKTISSSSLYKELEENERTAIDLFLEYLQSENNQSAN